MLTARENSGRFRLRTNLQSPIRICQRLLHRQELEGLAAEAQTAREAGEVREEIAAWRRTLELLPLDSRQYESIATRVGELSRSLDEARGSSSGPEPGNPSRGRWSWAGLGALGVLAWKLKSVLAFLVTKGKFLALGLTKSNTAFSMILSLGVYWTAFGWKFALGLIVSIYIHEMGHVAALHHLGIRASAPMFLPGLGAVVRLRQYPVDAREDARVGLAGPLWGLGAAILASGVFLASGAPIWGAIARVGAWINLFNLLPVWQLDGSRGFRALSRGQGFLITAVVAAMWFLTGEGLLVVLLLLAGFKAWRTPAARRGDQVAFVQFLILVAALSAMCLIQAPIK